MVAGQSSTSITRVLFPGVGMDSCVIPLRHGGLSLVQTTDFFYPLVEDPYMMVSWCKHTCGHNHSHLL